MKEWGGCRVCQRAGGKRSSSHARGRRSRSSGTFIPREEPRHADGSSAYPRHGRCWSKSCRGISRASSRERGVSRGHAGSKHTDFLPSPTRVARPFPCFHCLLADHVSVWTRRRVQSGSPSSPRPLVRRRREDRSRAGIAGLSRPAGAGTARRPHLRTNLRNGIRGDGRTRRREFDTRTISLDWAP